MPYYESVFIARQDISSAQVESLIKTFEKAITDGGGAVPKKESWGLRTLAYRIKKNRKGHYVLLNIDAPADAVHEMERQMRLNEDVLRNLTTRVDNLEEGPSVIMRNKDRSDDRNRNDRPHRDNRPRNDRSHEAQTDAVTNTEAKAPSVNADLETEADDGDSKKKGEDK